MKPETRAGIRRGADGIGHSEHRAPSGRRERRRALRRSRKARRRGEGGLMCRALAPSGQGSVEVQFGFSEPIIPGPLGHASPNDQTKSRRIQALDGSGAGSPTGGVLSAARMLMPSLPSLSTDETAWQLMQE